MKRWVSFLSFALVGGLATALQYFILVALVHAVNMDPITASTIGYGFSGVFNYYLNYHYTFRSRKSHSEAFSRFAMVSVMGLVLNSFTMAIGTRLFRLHYLLAQIASTVIVLLWNFYANLFTLVVSREKRWRRTAPLKR